MFSRRLLLCAVAALGLFAVAVTAGKGGGGKPPPPEPPPDPAILYHISYGFPDDQIWVMNADGTNKRAVITADMQGVPALDPTWSPDNTKLAYSGRYYSFTQYAIDVANLDGSDPERLHILGLGAGGGNPDWAPATLPGQPTGDQRILFDEWTGAATDLFAIRPDGTGLVNLTATEYRSEQGVSVSHDGTFVIFDARTWPDYGGDGQRRGYKGTLGTDANGDPAITSETCLTDDGPLASLNCFPAVVDPTGANVAVRAEGEIWIIPLSNPAGAWRAAIPSTWFSGGHAWLDDRTLVYTIYVAKPRQFYLVKGDIYTGSQTTLDHLKSPDGSIGDPATRR